MNVKGLVKVLCTGGAILLLASLAGAAHDPVPRPPGYGKCQSSKECRDQVACNGGVCADWIGGTCTLAKECGPAGAKCTNKVCSTSPEGSCTADKECPFSRCEKGKCL